jgi:hypothetical protein
MQKIIFFFISLVTIFCINNSVLYADVNSRVESKKCPPDQVCLDDPLNGATPEIIIGRGVNAALGLTGTIALLMFIWGGFTWMFAMGAPEKVKKGRDIMVWTAIGLVVIFSAYGLVQFVFKAIAGTT